MTVEQLLGECDLVRLTEEKLRHRGSSLMEIIE